MVAVKIYQIYKVNIIKNTHTDNYKWAWYYNEVNTFSILYTAAVLITQSSGIDWAWFYVCTNTIQVIRPTVFTGLMTQPTVSKHWRRVVSHPDRPQSNHAHLTVLQYLWGCTYMHADITQENNQERDTTFSYWLNSSFPELLQIPKTERLQIIATDVARGWMPSCYPTTQ